MPEFLNSPLGVALGTTVGLAVPWLLIGPLWWWLSRRDQRRWDRDEAERRRQWALQQQLRELEDQIWRESLPDWQREAIAEADRKRVAITQEARRRLGLPDEATP
jgi:hypothetical protein